MGERKEDMPGAKGSTMFDSLYQDWKKLNNTYYFHVPLDVLENCLYRQTLGIGGRKDRNSMIWDERL